MRVTTGIFALIFLCVCSSDCFAQTKHKRDWLGVDFQWATPAKSNFLQTPGPSLSSMRCVRSEPEKLPFFCNMENKFRNKYNVFLKFRVGTDDSYEKLINSCKR